MLLSRRDFLAKTATAALLSPALSRVLQAADPDPNLIVDTHQHLWDLSWQKLPWLAGAPEILRHSYTTADYRAATPGLNLRTIYMEVDVDPAQHHAEVEHIVELCRSPDHPTTAAVVGGRPAHPGFADYVTFLKQAPAVKGVRQVLHGQTRRGYCLGEDFVRGIKLLGEEGLSFDLCLRPGELVDGAELAGRCPQTRFVVDHCGNADPKAFDKKLAGDQEPDHGADQWRRDMEQLAAQPHVICKISGIVARAPAGWRPEHLAPVVDHCLDTFGTDRVVFGSDWPVCLLGAPLMDWVNALKQIVAERPADQRAKLWRENAVRFYSLG